MVVHDEPVIIGLFVDVGGQYARHVEAVRGIAEIFNAREPSDLSVQMHGNIGNQKAHMVCVHENRFPTLTGRRPAVPSLDGRIWRARRALTW